MRAARFGLFRFEGMPNESSRAAYSGRATEYIDLLGSMSSVHPSDLQIVSTWAGDVHGNLIDAGCGPGHWTNFLTQQSLIARGIDQVAEFIAHATNAFATVDFATKGLDSIDVGTNSVGGVLSWYSLIHYEPGAIQVSLREFSRVIKPGGILLIGSLRAPRSRSSRTRSRRRTGGPCTRSARGWAAPASTLSNRMCGKLQASALKRRSALDARMLAKGSAYAHVLDLDLFSANVIWSLVS